MDKKITNYLLIFLILISIFVLAGIYGPGHFSYAQTVEQQQADLQKQLQDLENQITQYQKDLKTIQGQKNTLQNKISQLKKQQASLELQIKATGLKVDSLAIKINSTQMSIDKNTSQSDQLKGQIGEVIKLINANDNYPVLYMVFGNNSISDIFTEFENQVLLVQNLNDLLDQKKQIDAQLQAEAKDLAQEQDDAQNLHSILSLQEQGVTDTVSQQKNLLQQTKGKESNYQANLSDAKKQAQAIKARLYSLLEVQKQINFGQAVAIAQWASKLTGVRPAFLLAILTQESSLGRNVGTCNRAGDPPTKSYKVVMHPTRDIPPFLDITSNLGMNPDTTPISCPMHDKQGNQIGWGGAMGPAQFIPSTWKGWAAKVTAITGKTSNPWDIRDAFLASALKLANDGATSTSGEWAAAMRYFSGSTNSKYSFYGDSVVAQADKYQSDIDQLNSN